MVVRLAASGQRSSSGSRRVRWAEQLQERAVGGAMVRAMCCDGEGATGVAVNGMCLAHGGKEGVA